MKSLFERFTLMDFFGYLFPGIVALAGVLAGLQLTAWKSTIQWIDLGLTESLLALVFAYVFGVVLSGFSWPLYWASNGLYLRWMNRRDPREEIHPVDFATDVQDVFCKVLGIDLTQKPWTPQHFYLARSLVDRCMPRHAELAARQNALRVFRQYMLPPLVIWIIVGVMWGQQTLEQSRLAGWLMIIGSTVFGLLGLALVTDRLWRNRRREVREVCLALLVGRSVDAFSPESPGVNL